MRGVSRRVRRPLVIGLAVALVMGLAVVGVRAWLVATRSPLEQALHAVPAGSLRVGFTDWAAVRREVGGPPGADPSRQAVDDFIDKVYDRDFSAASSIDESASALQELFGFSPATAAWEAFAQGREGAAMVLKLPEADFGQLEANLAGLGFERPKEGDGVWDGGVDLVSALDPTITPELQHVVLLEDEQLVVSSDNPDFVEVAAAAARGDRATVAGVEGVDDLLGAAAEPVNAMVWSGDFACEDLAMSKAADDDQALADELVREAGGVDPLSGLLMAMDSGRRLQVVQRFEDGDDAERNLRPRARLAVGEAVGRGGSFDDDFELTSSSASGRTVRLELTPREGTEFVLSALYDGPVLFATC